MVAVAMLGTSTVSLGAPFESGFIGECILRPGTGFAGHDDRRFVRDRLRPGE
jgi:hypothetical protein